MDLYYITKTADGTMWFLASIWEFDHYYFRWVGSTEGAITFSHKLGAKEVQKNYITNMRDSSVTIHKQTLVLVE